MFTIDTRRTMVYWWLTVRLDSKYSEQINTYEFSKAMNLAFGQGGLKLEINVPSQHILAESMGGGL